MAHTLDEALENIRSQRTLIDSFSATLAMLREQAKAAKGDQAKIDAIFDAAESNREALVAAQVENTEAAPATQGFPTETAPPDSSAATSEG